MAIEIDNIVFNLGNNSKDITNVQVLGPEIDDYNEPAPENVPTPESREEVNMHMASQSWGWTDIDTQAVTVASDVKPSLTNVKGEALKNITFVKGKDRPPQKEK